MKKKLLQEINLKDIPCFQSRLGKPQYYLSIFPDRFYNGNKDNDPDFSEWYWRDCKEPPSPGEILSPKRNIII